MTDGGGKSGDGGRAGFRGLGLAMSIPFMLATGPLLGFYIGYWIDGLAGTGFVRFIMLFLGFVAGVRSVLRVLKEDAALPRMGEGGAGTDISDGEYSMPQEVPESSTSSVSVDEFSEKFEVDGEIIGLMHYSRRKTGSRFEKNNYAGGAPDSVHDGNEHVKNEGEIREIVQGDALVTGRSLLALPVIVSVGLWTTIIASSAAALAGQKEIGAGILASGLWNILNFLALWLVFKLVFSNNPYRIFFTLPVVCIKIPLLYFLVVELFRLNLFDRLGLTLGLLALPAVFLFLALLNGRA